MPNDYLKKEPSKQEKMVYELFLHQQQTDRSVYSNSMHILTVGMLLGLEPEKVAEALVNGEEKIKEYGTKLNQAIDKLHDSKPGHEHNNADSSHTHGVVAEPDVPTEAPTKTE